MPTAATSTPPVRSRRNDDTRVSGYQGSFDSRTTPARSGPSTLPLGPALSEAPEGPSRRVPWVPGVRESIASAATWMSAAAAQLGHALRFLAVFGAVLAEFTVRGDRAGTTGVGALLRLVHEASCSRKDRAIVAQARTIQPRRRPATRPEGRSSGAPWELGALGLRRGVAWGGRPRVPLALGPQDAAPLLVLGDRHPALDADAHPLPRFGIA